jgi:plasmid stabilization system protein ParE
LRRIVWTDDAIAKLEAIKTYVDVSDPAAAARLAGRLVEVADSLAGFPDCGREAGGGKREMTTVWPYSCGTASTLIG